MTYYDENGKEIIINKDPKFGDKIQGRICAYRGVGEKNIICKVLSRSGYLFKKDLSLKDKNREEWKLINVNENCFALYLEYLKTGAEFRYYEALRQI